MSKSSKLAEARQKHHEATCDLEIATARWLRSCGWERTCDVPGSFWGWVKQMPDGRHVFVTESMAIKMQEDETPVPEPDEVPS